MFFIFLVTWFVLDYDKKSEIEAEMYSLNEMQGQIVSDICMEFTDISSEVNVAECLYDLNKLEISMVMSDAMRLDVKRDDGEVYAKQELRDLYELKIENYANELNRKVKENNREKYLKNTGYINKVSSEVSWTEVKKIIRKTDNYIDSHFNLYMKASKESS